jgi:uridine nucleosidase
MNFSLAESAQIVLNAPVKKTMIPLNVTHTAIVNERIQKQLLTPGIQTLTGVPLPEISSRLRLMLSSLVSFFADTYKSKYGFTEGPPLHDALTIAYVARSELFTTQRRRVDVELHGKHTSGETVVDVWQHRTCDDSWGVNGKNCNVARSVDVSLFYFCSLKI